MKKLLYIILLLPLWATAQNVSMNKTGGQLRTMLSGTARDTVPMVTGALVDGYILKYHAATNKWYASPDPTYPGLQDSLTKKANRTFDNVASGAIANVKLANSTISGVALGSNLNTLTLGNGLTGTSYNGSANVTATADTSVVQTVSNFFPKGDTRYQKLSNQLNGTGIVEMSGTTPSYLSSTGTGNVVKATSPTLVTPNIGVATGTSLDLNGKLKFTTSTTPSTSGDIGFSSTYGLYTYAKTGSVDDWAVFAAAGGYILHNPTGTTNLALGSLTGTGTRMVVADNAGVLSTQAIPSGGGGGTVASVSVNSANGFAGTSSGGVNPALTLSTTVTGIVKGNGTSQTAAVDGSDYVSPTTSVNTSSTIATWTQNNTTNGFGFKILSEGTASDRYALSLQNLAENQTYLHVLTETGKVGSVVVGSKVPYTGLSSNGFTVNGTSYGSIGLNLNDVNKGYLSSYTNGLLLQSDGRLVINNNIGNVIIGTTTDDGSNKFQLTGNAAITGNITASNLGTASGYSAQSNTGALTIPIRDTNGDFAAGNITATLTGNASTATALQTARTISGVSFNGTANITLNNNAITNGAGYITSAALSTYAPLASPTFTGTVSGITAAMVGAPSGSGTSTGTNTGDQNLAPYAPLASPALTGNPTAPTQTQGDNSTKIATTAYVDGAVTNIGTGNNYTPTASTGSNVVSTTVTQHKYTSVDNFVTVYGKLTINYTSDNTVTTSALSLPASATFTVADDAIGHGISDYTTNGNRSVYIEAIPSTNNVLITVTSPVQVTKTFTIKYSFMYEKN